MIGDRFKGKVVWITGASSGIGRALAFAFDRAGAKLILSGRDARSLEPVRQACRVTGDVHLLPFDLADLDTIPQHAEEALRLWGHVDYMVHNAGIALRGRMSDTPLRLDQQVMATNYFGPVALTKALLPSMLERQSGCFVVVSSLSGTYGAPQLSSYSASKHALHGSFESLRAEVHDQHIQITLVVPGFIRTPILQNALTGRGARYGKTMPAYERGMDPDLCAARILEGVSREKEEVLIGGWELSTWYLKRFFPTWLSALVRNHPIRLWNNLRRLLRFRTPGRDDDPDGRAGPGIASIKEDPPTPS
jgi:dehydrogenase/reductase SDR family protein 7B